MTGVALAINASAGSPSYSARAFRNALSSMMQWNGDPVGGKQGLRPMGGTAVVTLAASTITANLHSGLIAPGWASTTGTYMVALTASETHTLTPADASNPRKDIVIGRVYDHDESASGLRLYRSEYLAGVAGPSPSEPNVPQGAIRLATIDVPQSGGGSPAVTVNNPMTVAAGGLLPIRSQAERAALTTAYEGMSIYRMDRDWWEYHDGALWRVLGTAVCTSTADRDAAITGPYNGQFCVTTDSRTLWYHNGTAWEGAAARGTKGGIARTAADTDVGTSEALVNSRTLTAVQGRTYVLKFPTNMLSAGGSVPAALMMRFRWAPGVSVTTAGTLIQTINDFISTGAFQHYSNFETSIDWTAPTQQVTFGVFALALAPMTILRFVNASGSQREFRVDDLGVTNG